MTQERREVAATARNAISAALASLDQEARASHERQRRRRAELRERRRTAEQALIDEIARAAERLAAARDSSGNVLFRTDGVWRVLAAVGSSRYCLAIADLARALGVRRQTAQELAYAAERAHVVELAPNREDKRILQLLLTPRGEAALAAERTARAIWRSTLLNGLGDREMAATTHVVRVIRQRLERHARELERSFAVNARRRAAQD